MAYTDIDKPSDNFSATLYTGNATARTIATGHQSDWVWLKRRDGTAGHRIADSVRGATKLIYSDSNTSEQTDAKSITGFVSTGFTLGDDANGYDVNTNTNTMVAWSWKAGTSFTNDASSTGIGSIDSAGSVSTTAGFSIIRFSGTGSQGTVAHGLGAVPHAIFFKRLDANGAWASYHKPLGATKYMRLDSNSAQITASDEFNDTEPTSTVFTVDTDGGVNASGTNNMIAYCFAEKQGYSKFGSYIGNGNADGAFIYTGQKSAFIMLKNTTRAASWLMFDNKRLGYNVDNNEVVANTSAAEETYDQLDILSNGFKMRANGTSTNLNGDIYIYMAFAENPFVTSGGVPATAR